MTQIPTHLLRRPGDRRGRRVGKEAARGSSRVAHVDYVLVEGFQTVMDMGEQSDEERDGPSPTFSTHQCLAARHSVPAFLLLPPPFEVGLRQRALLPTHPSGRASHPQGFSFNVAQAQCFMTTNPTDNNSLVLSNIESMLSCPL